MLCVTGDTHRSVDIEKINKVRLKKGDYLIIAGDFGGVWYGDKRDDMILNWYGNKGFTTLFVDGNHENHNALDKLPVSIWKGGKVHKIRGNLIHLMRGQVYDIEGYKIFTFGGADSIDKGHRCINLSWWEREMPSFEEYDEGLENLKNNDWKVDYVITHTCPEQIFGGVVENFKNVTSIEKYLSEVYSKLDFNKWYFGHFHDDKVLGEDFRLLYNDVIELGK